MIVSSAYICNAALGTFYPVLFIDRVKHEGPKIESWCTTLCNLWSTVSNTLEKSIKRARKHSFLSRASVILLTSFMAAVAVLRFHLMSSPICASLQGHRINNKAGIVCVWVWGMTGEDKQLPAFYVWKVWSISLYKLKWWCDSAQQLLWEKNEKSDLPWPIMYSLPLQTKENIV